MEVNMNPLQRQMLDDVFDAFTMLTNGAMCSLMHVDGGYTRFTPSSVELFGLPGEYVPNGAINWNDYLHPEDRKRYMDVINDARRQRLVFVADRDQSICRDQ